ncbi:MAG: SOS-response transcriptional repressors (RecA-mediated autopeptidase) [Gammaproteobacteria bacterium]|jgi:SOS-response transcriptional repressor LexA|nr:SOS-response transcriptional repressors (RecA-mediated autopeptidase) [Gammaproteobacteria bacterium]
MHLVDIATIQERAKNEEIGFSERVLLILKQQNKSKAWLAQQIGISNQALQYVLKCSSNPRTKYVIEIATALEVSPEWLLFGKGNRQSLSEESTEIARIPILPLNHVPLFTQKDSGLLTDEFTHITLSSPCSCFATLLENSCMEPFFQRGTLLLFNSLGNPRNGDYVIFSLAKNNDVLFREYFREGKTTYFKAMNPLYESYKCNNPATIFGVLIESRNHFK